MSSTKVQPIRGFFTIYRNYGTLTPKFAMPLETTSTTLLTCAHFSSEVQQIKDGALLPQKNSKGSYRKVLPFAVFIGRALHLPHSDNKLCAQSKKTPYPLFFHDIPQLRHSDAKICSAVRNRLRHPAGLRPPPRWCCQICGWRA